MKRIILLALLLLAASSCATTTQAPGNANDNTGANASASPAATPKAEASPAANDAAIAREKEIWGKIKDKNPDGFGAMLADDFVYVTEDGVFDKAGTVDGIKQMAPTDVSFSDWKVVTVDKDAVVVAYTVNMKGTNGGQPMPETPIRASSVWVNRGGKWVGVFHQDTPVKEAPAGQTADTGKPMGPMPPSADPSSPPEAPDPISKEKKVWEELKRKDYDAFASDLAEEAIEVEPDGVYDKAGSVNGVKMFDASKFTLSNFKEVKIDADASVVTYTVKSGDGKEEERHSTVWSKRGQRWYAVLHHGTPVKRATAKK